MPTIKFTGLIMIVMLILISACEPTAVQIIPTDLPTITATYTPTATRTPGRDATPTQRPTQVAQATGGPSPTPLLGATRTPIPDDFPTPTRAFNPNAPRIEFFTSDVLSVEPGGVVTLYWSARGVDNVVIYRLNRDGERSQVYNVAPDGSLEVSTRSSDRGELQFVLGAGEGGDYVEETLSLPLQCPVTWFFTPSPDECATAEAEETIIVDQTFERGRMLYIAARDRVYVLFNDGLEPAWLSFDNEYDPAIHPERDENAPPEFIQPLRELGLIWRGEDVVRNRLGLGIAEASTFDGFIQTSPAQSNTENLFVSGANGNVLQIVPGGEVWQIIGA